MSFNLCVSHFRNGDEIPHCETDEEWIAAAKNQQPAWCSCNGDSKNDNDYGRLYNWFAVTDSRGLVPKGYRMLNRNNLLDFVRGDAEMQLAGIRTVDLIHVVTTNKIMNDRVEFLRLGQVGYWWLPSEYPKYQRLKGDMAYRSNQIPIALNSGFYFAEKGNGLSVRCTVAQIAAVNLEAKERGWECLI